MYLSVAVACGNDLLCFGNNVLDVEVVGLAVESIEGHICVLAYHKEVGGVINELHPLYVFNEVEHSLGCIAVDALFVFVVEASSLALGDALHLVEGGIDLLVSAVSLIEAEGTDLVCAEDPCKLCHMAHLFLVFVIIIVELDLAYGRAHGPYLYTRVGKCLCIFFRFLKGNVENIFVVYSAKLNIAKPVSFQSRYLTIKILVRLIGECR